MCLCFQSELTDDIVLCSVYSPASLICPTVVNKQKIIIYTHRHGLSLFVDLTAIFACFQMADSGLDLSNS